MNEKPSEYNFEEITIGQKINFKEKITEKMINNFANISGDFNPLHIDENYASSTSFGRRMCHGFLLASFFSRLVGMYLPGKNSLYFTQSLNFMNPCFIEDEIIIEGTIIDKSESTKIITMSTKITRTDGLCLLDGVARVMVRNEKHD